MLINVMPVDDSPIFITSTDRLSIAEDEEIRLRDHLNVSIYDADFIHEPPVISLSVITRFGGTLRLIQPVPGLAMTTSAASSNISFRASMDVINNGLRGLLYSPRANLDTFDTIIFQIHDGAQEDRIKHDVGNFTLHVDISPLNDAPVINMPEIIPFNSDSDLIAAIRGIFITDVDSDPLTDAIEVSVSVSPAGILIMPNETVLPVEITIAVGSQSIMFKGVESAVNEAMHEIWIQQRGHYEGNCTLVILSADEHGAKSERMATFLISKKKAIAFITFSETPLELLEDESRYLESLSLQNDTQIDPLSILEISLSSDIIKEFIVNTQNICGIHITQVGPGMLIMQGMIEPINEAFEHIEIVPLDDFHGAAVLSVGLSLIDGVSSEESHVRQDLDLRVRNADDPSVVLWHRSEVLADTLVLETEEDSLLFFEGLSVTDIDGGLYLQITISGGQNGLVCLHEDNFELKDGFISHDHSSCGVNSSLTLNGTLADVNKKLQALYYIPHIDWWGHDEIFLAVSSGGTFTTTNIFLRVTSKNDCPLIHFQTRNDSSHLIIEEDNSLLINFITISDVDANDYERYILEVSLSVENGTVDFRENFLAHMTPSDESGIVLLRGSVKELNTALRNLVYTPSENFHGNDSLIVTVADFDNFSDESSLGITITSVNDIPTMSLPDTNGNGYLTTIEDVVGIIGADCDHLSPDPAYLISCDGIAVFDVEAHEMEKTEIMVYLQCEQGMIHLSQLKYVKGIDISAEDTNGTFSRVLNLSGPVEAVNSVLSLGLLYLGRSNFNGLDQMNITVIDSFGSSTSSSLAIKVKAINDSPELELLGQRDPIMIAEDEVTELGRIARVQDVDILSSVSAFLEIDIRAAEGVIMVGEEAPIQRLILGKAGIFSSRLKFQSNLWNCNNVLDMLWYQPPRNYVGADSLMFTVSDLGNFGSIHSGGEFNLPDSAQALNDTISLPISIFPQADSPTMTIIEYIEVVEDMPTVIEPSIYIGHTDSDDTEVSLSIMTSNGSVKLSSTIGLRFSVGGSDAHEETIAAFGSVSSWNQALQNLTYTAAPNWNTQGEDLEEVNFIVTNADQSMAHPTESTYTMYIGVKPKNDAPEWSIQHLETITVNEDEDITLDYISIFDVDLNGHLENTFMTVILEVNFGTIALMNTDGLFFVDSKNGNQKLHWRATYKNTNAALSAITYRGFANFHGDDVLTLFASDEGNIGEGTDALTSKMSIPIVVKSISDSPILNLPYSVVHCGEEELCVIKDVSIEDPDHSTMCTLKLSVLTGKIALARMEFPSTVKILKGITGGDNKICIYGPLKCINSVLKDLVYMGSVGSSGSTDAVNIQASTGPDESGMMSSVEGMVVVAVIHSEKNAPSIHYSGATYKNDVGCKVSRNDNLFPFALVGRLESHRENVKCKRLLNLEPFLCLEDKECGIHGITISDTGSGLLELSITAQNGIILIGADSLSGVNFVTGKPRLRATEEPKEVNKPQREIVLRGAVNQINESLEHLLYVGDPDFFGNDKIDLIAKDTKDRSAQNYLTIEVDIKGIDDLPMVAGPSETKDVMEDHFLSINEFKIVDPDVDTGLNEFYGKFCHWKTAVTSNRRA